MILSGTFLDSLWSDIFGLLRFLSGHPFLTEIDFKNFISEKVKRSWEYLSEFQIRLLQKLLMAITITRPANYLRLPGLTKWIVRFELNKTESGSLKEDLHGYRAALKDKYKKKYVFAYLARAHQATMHTKIIAQRNDEEDKEDEADNYSSGDYEGGEDVTDNGSGEEDEAGDNDNSKVLHNAMIDRRQTVNQRQSWLADITNSEDLMDSSCLKCLKRLYMYLRREYPDQMIVIISISSKFLDLVGVMLRKFHRVKSLRYDGTVSSLSRETVRENFRNCDPSTPYRRSRRRWPEYHRGVSHHPMRDLVEWIRHKLRSRL